MGEPVQKPILYGGRFAGLNREYSGEYSSGALAAGSGSARRGYGAACGSAGLGVHGSARLEYGARGRHSSSTSGARGLRVGFCTEYSGGACGLPPSPMKLILAAVSSS